MSDVFVGRADEQNRLRLLLGQLDDVSPDEGRVVLVRGQGGVGKSTLLARMREIVTEARPRSGWRRRHLTTVFLDWGEDPLRSVVAASADGPEVWRLLAAVEAALEEVCGAVAERAFDDFRRQASQLPELVERAKKLLLHEHGGAQPQFSTREGQELLAGMGALGLNMAGVPVGQKSVEKAVTGLLAAGSAARRLRRGSINPELFWQLVDAKSALIRAFGQGVRALSRRRPVVIVMDTCELLGPTLLELRQIVARSGARSVWVLGTRLEDGQQRAENSIAEQLIRGIHHTRLHDMPLLVFDNDSAAAYLSARRSDLTRHEIAQVVSFSRGLPLALALVVQALEDGMRIEEICEQPTVDRGLPSGVVQKLAQRYLTHTATIPRLAEDRAKLCALALARYNDPDVLSALWDIPAGDVRTVTDRLTIHHDFMSSHHRVLHDDVRSTLLNLLLRKDERAAVREANQRAVDFLRARAARAGHQCVDEQLADDQWRRDITALVWHTFWADPRMGTTLLLQLLPWAEPVPDFRDQLIQHAQFFAPTCLPDDAAVLTGLRGFNDTDWWGEPAGEIHERRASRQRVLSVCTTAPQDVAAQPPASIYRNLWAAATARAAGLPATDAVALLETAAHYPLAPGTPTARHTARLASDLVHGCHSMREMTVAEQQDELGLRQIIVRHDPNNSGAHTGLGDCLAETGRWADAEDTYRTAIQHNPANSNAHTGLGSCLAQSGRWADAEHTYRTAIQHNPANSNAHTGLGNCLAQTGRLPDAERAYQDAIYYDPINSSAHNGLGYVQWARADVAAAETSFRWSLSIEDSAVVGVRLGLLLLHTGRTNEARSVLENTPAGSVHRELLLAVALRPSNPAQATACVQAALAASEHPANMRRLMTPFIHAHERALALAAAGRGAEGAIELRAASETRTPGALFEKPRYDLLATIIDSADLEPVLQVWREIITADLHACGPWGPPP